MFNDSKRKQCKISNRVRPQVRGKKLLRELIMTQTIAVLAGDGIGPEIMAEAVKVLECLRDNFSLDIQLEEALVGGAAIDATGIPLPAATLALAKRADAVLLGAVGGPKWEPLDISIRPEKGYWDYAQN